MRLHRRRIEPDRDAARDGRAQKSSLYSPKAEARSPEKSRSACRRISKHLREGSSQDGKGGAPIPDSSTAPVDGLDPVVKRVDIGLQFVRPRNRRASGGGLIVPA